MFCRKCGKQLEEGMKFCPKCGSSMSEMNREEEIKEQVFPGKDEMGLDENVYQETREEKTEGLSEAPDGEGEVEARESNSLENNEPQNVLMKDEENEKEPVSDVCKCPECGTNIFGRSVCPICGYHLEKEISEFQPTKKSEVKEKVKLVISQGKKWYSRRSEKERMIIVGIFLVISFAVGILFHRGIGIKKEEYQNLLSTNAQLEKQVTYLKSNLSSESEKHKEEQKKFKEYKEKMQPYEEIQLTDAKNKAEAEKLRIEKELQEKAEKEAAEKAEAERLAAEEAAAKAAEEARGYETGITYNQLARTPDEYEGKKVKFKGKVIQVIEGTLETQIRLAVNSDYDDILFCSIPKNLTASTRILEDDYITIMGISEGLISYESTMGGQITIPSVSVKDWGPN